MDSKAIIFLLTSFLLLIAMVSSSTTDEELNIKTQLLAVDPMIVPSPDVKAPVIAAPPPSISPVITVPPPPKSPVIITPTPPIIAPPLAPVVKPPTIAPRPPIRFMRDCTVQCGERCNVHFRKKMCMRACGTCCSRCKCVPPGTSGNREMCGTCYTGMKTHGDRFKCP